MKKYKITVFIILFCVVFGKGNHCKKQQKVCFPTLVFSTSVIGSSVLLAFDDKINYFFVNTISGRSVLNRVAQNISDIGSPSAEITFFTATYIGAKIFKYPKVSKFAGNEIRALITTGISTEIIKHLSSRMRPSVADNSKHWGGPQVGIQRYYLEEVPNDFSSFPSGHSALAWATASVISEHYKKIKGIRAAAYCLAVSVSLSRIALGEHWASDVVFGAGLGYLIGKITFNNKICFTPKLNSSQKILLIQIRI